MSKLDPKRQLTWGQVRRVNGGVILSITLAKTIQCGERVHHVTLPAAENPLFCPVRALQTLVDIRGAQNCTKGAIVFTIPDVKGCFRPLLKYEFVRWFRGRIGQMGADSSKYSCHGWRHGGIQQLLLAEDSTHMVRIASDHASDALYAYAEIPPERRMDTARKMLSSLSIDLGI